MLAVGGGIVLPDMNQIKEPAHWLKAITHQGVTLWNTVPMFMQMLVEYLDYLSMSETLHVAKTLRTVLLSGDWIPLNLPERIRQYFSGSQVISLGGATEGSIWSILYSITDVKKDWKSIPYGRPMANQTMYVLDKDLKHCPMGVLGDIYIGGKGVALEYWRDKKTTAISFIKHPVTGKRLYKTGDLGRWNADGYMEFVGRKDTQVKIDGYRVELGDIETALSQHPSVKQSVVSTYQKGSHKKLVAYVVPNRSFIETLGKKEDLTEDWSKVYEGVYQEKASSEDLTFNIAGWNSSYTGKPLPSEEMQEWVNHTVECILSLKPMSVLEIGCGTGLLVSRIATFCKTYVATDISKTALELIERMKNSLEGLKHVVTAQKSADDFNGLDSFSFDTIVINSVTQCFPSVDYLARVIKGAVSLLKGGGHLFIGDMRNLALLKSHHASVQLHQASDPVTQEEFVQRVQSHLEQEEELLIDPLFFHALRSKMPQIQHVQVHLKKGKYPNELNRFRFDALLEIGEKAMPTVVPTYRPWSLEKNSLLTLRQHLLEWKTKCSKETPEALGFKGLPNARLQTETLALDWLNGDLDIKTVGELRTYKADSHAIDPAALYQLGEELGLRVETTGNLNKPTSLFDVVFTHIPESIKGPVFTPFSETCSDEMERYTNVPMLSKARRVLTSLFKEHCQTKLPSYMVPAYFTLLERLPLSPNGKVDRKALPIPLIQQQSEVDQVTLITPTEKVMKDMWAEVLGLEGIGMNDNFFSLGGSSLLAVRLVMKANQHFETNYPVSILFTHNTLREFANLFQSKEKLGSYRPLLPFHQEGKRPPLFFVHSGRGGAEAYVTLASHFDKDQPLYIIESYNLCNKPPFLTTIEDMATKYLTHVREVQAKGPYYLGGWSQGGLIAYEMAQTLTKQKEEARALYFLDTFWFTNFENSQFRSLSRIDNFLKNDPFYTKLPIPYRDHVKDVDRVQTLAMANYKPAPYTGDVILLKASDHWTFLDTPEFKWDWITRKYMHHVFSKKQNGWDKYITKLKIYPVPGHHQSIMEGENARVMAHIIQDDVLERQKTEEQ
jgi:thioesterase domain-containing protein/2-polyprenyl-3-methyl-5-hydroxy-6-metoxy-1,4-benzoquinol methylase/acyl carrier protein